MRKFVKSEEITPEIREQRKPRLELWITRHANRAPTGELTPEGIATVRAKGEKVDAEVLKGYSSFEKSDRTYKTLQKISKESKIKSPSTEGLYQTRRRVGLYYDVVGPLQSRIKAQTKLINEMVKKDYPDYDPESKDPKWAKIRERYQPIGIRNVIADKEISHVLAMGAAYQFFKMAEIGERYIARRKSALKRGEKGARPIEKDIILNEGTHGGFIDLMLKKTMIRVKPDGNEKIGFDLSRDKKGLIVFEKVMGDVIRPTESIKTGYPVGEKLPERLPISFEQDRFKEEKCYISIPRVKLLAEQFRAYLEQLGKWNKGEIDEKELVLVINRLREEFEKEKKS